MIRDGLGKIVDFVTTHNLLTLAVMALLSAAVLMGIPQIDTESQAGTDADAFEDLQERQAATYIQQHFTPDRDGQNRTLGQVYVHEDGGNALSKESLLTGLEFQQRLQDSAAVRRLLHEDGIVGFSNLVAVRAADDRNATLDEQIAAMENTSAAEVQQLVGETLEEPGATRFVPADHDPSSTTANSRRILLWYGFGASEQTFVEALSTITQTVDSQAGFFMSEGGDNEIYRDHFFGEMIELVVPAALLLIVGVLAFTYRDLVDVVVGMVGVVLSILWMFGLLGWLDVSAGMVSVVPVVLISGLSIDFGFHVFNRYREQREAGAQRPPQNGERGANATRERGDGKVFAGR